MKRISAFAAAALAALALTAVAGSATASADTVLCDSYVQNYCPSSEVLPAGSWLSFHTPELTLKSDNGLVNLACNAGIAAKSTAERGIGFQPLAMKGFIPLLGCNLNGKATCTEYVANEPGTGLSHFTGTSGGLGVLNIGSPSNPLTISFACQSSTLGGAVNCSYAAEKAVTVTLWDQLQGEVAQVTSGKKMLRTSGSASICGASVELNAQGLNESKNHPATI